MMPQQAGLEAQAMVEVNQAVRFLIGAIGKLKGVDTDLGKGVVDALRILGKVVPEVSESVGQSEVASLLGQAQAVKPGGAGGPQQPPPAGPQPQPPTMLGTGRPMPMPMR
jgi:hypothetical protein